MLGFFNFIMFTVYILYSQSYCKTYVGFTGNILRRIEEHNITGISGYTKKYRPWSKIHSETYENKILAMAREKYLKTGIGREEVKMILKNYLLNQNSMD
jgi:putative endonuclease